MELDDPEQTNDICPLSFVGQQCFVKRPAMVGGAANDVQTVQMSSMPFIPLYVAGQQRFVRRPATVLQTLPGFDKFEDSLYSGKYVRQMCEGQEDSKGNDVSGFFFLSDVAFVLLFDSLSAAINWTRRVAKNDFAKDLKWIDSGNSSVSLLLWYVNIFEYE